MKKTPCIWCEYKPHLLLLLTSPAAFFPPPKLLADHSPPLKHVFAGGHCREPFKPGQKETAGSSTLCLVFLKAAFPNLTGTKQPLQHDAYLGGSKYPFKYGLDVVPAHFCWGRNCEGLKVTDQSKQSILFAKFKYLLGMGNWTIDAPALETHTRE